MEKGGDRNKLARETIKEARKVVVKVGTNVLMKKAGLIHRVRMRALVRQLAELTKEKYQVVLVTSGAIGAGLEALGLNRRPRDLPGLQIAAAVGQSLLMAEYGRMFKEEGTTVAQVLLTHDDLRNRKRHLNMRNTIMGLLERGIVPIVNENDVIAVDELRFGDNDMLAALLSSLIQADLLVLLSTTNGLKAPLASGRMERIPYVHKVDEEVKSWAYGKGSELSTGGMESKLNAVELVLSVPASVVIADGRDPKNLGRLFTGKDVGTMFGSILSHSPGDLNSRKRWIAYFHKPKGGIVVDSGAARALCSGEVSLLAVGVIRVEGEFAPGDVVNVLTQEGKLLARGLVSYSSTDVLRIAGKKSRELAEVLGQVYYEEVIHRDNIVIL